MIIDPISRILSWVGIISSIIIPLLFYIGFRDGNKKIPEVRAWLKKNSWKGDIHKHRLESWQQTDITYGNDFFYDLYFYANYGQGNKLYSAKALIRPGEMHMIQRGMIIYIKCSPNGKKMVVMKIEY
ncbi:hypothetical protein [Serratia sp. DD3]|uniref:hypothetical protein n=1 Tax=Serratia sp. DD3 TaxID=1410619 RepID=UPI0004D7EEDA|nr:hypothetical protein [Serratia sp. DD3]KEY59009.1 hypothetical protein SRDD_20940 [Serratia sp. DD3]